MNINRLKCYIKYKSHTEEQAEILESLVPILSFVASDTHNVPSRAWPYNILISHTHEQCLMGEIWWCWWWRCSHGSNCKKQNKRRGRELRTTPTPLWWYIPNKNTVKIDTDNSGSHQRHTGAGEVNSASTAGINHAVWIGVARKDRPIFPVFVRECAPGCGHGTVI